MPRKRHDSTPLERRARKGGAWPEPRENPTCKRCRDAGWFVIPAHGTTPEYAFACPCPAGETAPKGLPRWKEPKPREPLPEAPTSRRDAAAGRDDD